MRGGEGLRRWPQQLEVSFTAAESTEQLPRVLDPHPVRLEAVSVTI